MAKKTYFTINEFCKSETAEKLKIDNTPSKEIEKRIYKTIDFLNGLREAWGSPIRINSGYRCPELNKAVGGSKTSAHMEGWAADIVNMKGSYSAFKKFVMNYLKDKNFDQCILEKSSYTEWIHLAIYNKDGKQRRQLFNLVV